MGDEPTKDVLFAYTGDLSFDGQGNVTMTVADFNALLGRDGDACRLRAKLAEAERERDRLRRDANARFEKAKGDNLTIRKACRMREPLGGADAQCLEHALTMTEEERDSARRERDGETAEVVRLTKERTAALDDAKRMRGLIGRVLAAHAYTTEAGGMRFSVHECLDDDLRTECEAASEAEKEGK